MPSGLALQVLPAMCAAVVASCDIPSDIPTWDTRWFLRADSTRIGVEELLPDRVSLNPAGDAFAIDVAPDTLEWSLAEICPSCVALHGLTVPKPGFSGSVDEDAEFPSDVETVRVRTGSVVARVTNGFPFDPLRPTAGVFGSLTITLLDGDGTNLDSVVLPGAQSAFAPGGTVSVPLDIASVSVSEGFTVRVAIDSPAGDAVTVDANDRITVEVEPQLVLLESASVVIPAGSVDVDDVALDLEEIDSEIVSRVESGAIVLDVRNPFGVQLAVTIRIDGPSFPRIEKPVVVGGGNTEVRVELTGSELRSFLGQPDVILSGSGTVTAATDTQVVTPGQGVDLLAKLDLTLRIGG